MREAVVRGLKKETCDDDDDDDDDDAERAAVAVIDVAVWRHRPSGAS